jgi:hypothetical protein
MNIADLDMIASGKLNLDDSFTDRVVALTWKRHGKNATQTKAIALARELNPGSTLPMKVQSAIKDRFELPNKKREERGKAERASFARLRVRKDLRALAKEVYRSALTAARNAKLECTIGVSVLERSVGYDSASINLQQFDKKVPHFEFIVAGPRGQIPDAPDLVNISNSFGYQIVYYRKKFYEARKIGKGTTLRGSVFEANRFFRDDLCLHVHGPNPIGIKENPLPSIIGKGT